MSIATATASRTPDTIPGAAAGSTAVVTEARAAAEKSGRFDYDAKIEGVQALDRYTLRIRLKATDYVFPFKIAHTSYAAVAREVIELMPELPAAATELVESIIADRLPVRFQLQMHKFIWPQEQRGV